MAQLSNTELATLASGCFWCGEAIFQRLPGVVTVMSGYAGGKKANPSYQEVSSGESGYVEAVQLTFDPQLVSYQDILDIFWQSHDPTSLDKQGADVGPQYRSVIFYHTEEQREIAEAAKHQLNHSGKYQKPIVTEIRPFTTFYQAELEHQNFYQHNRDYPYCRLVIDPKLKKLSHLTPE